MEQNRRKNKQTIIDRAYFLLTFRQRTEKEIRDYLGKKAKQYGWSSESIDKTVQNLKKEELINDKEFIRLFVEKRTLCNPKSEYFLRNELLRLGIEQNLIEEYFSSHHLDEKKVARQILVKEWERLKKLPQNKRSIKAVQFLQRRGFGYQLIKKTIAEIEGKE